MCRCQKNSVESCPIKLRTRILRDAQELIADKHRWGQGTASWGSVMVPISDDVRLVLRGDGTNIGGSVAVPVSDKSRIVFKGNVSFAERRFLQTVDTIYS